jgi:hypothetical protein
VTKISNNGDAGSEDVLSTPEDVEILRETLNASIVLSSKEYRGLAHLDFTWGVNAHTNVYPDVLTFFATV